MCKLLYLVSLEAKAAKLVGAAATESRNSAFYVSRRKASHGAQEQQLLSQFTPHKQAALFPDLPFSPQRILDGQPVRNSRGSPAWQRAAVLGCIARGRACRGGAGKRGVPGEPHVHGKCPMSWARTKQPGWLCMAGTSAASKGTFIPQVIKHDCANVREQTAE